MAISQRIHNTVCYTNHTLIRGAQINNQWMTSLLLGATAAISVCALTALGLYATKTGGVKKVDIIRPREVEVPVDAATPPKKNWTLLSKKKEEAPVRRIEYSIETKEFPTYKKLGELALKALACTIGCHLFWTLLETSQHRFAQLNSCNLDTPPSVADLF